MSEEERDGDLVASKLAEIAAAAYARLPWKYRELLEAIPDDGINRIERATEALEVVTHELRRKKACLSCSVLFAGTAVLSWECRAAHIGAPREWHLVYRESVTDQASPVLILRANANIRMAAYRALERLLQALKSEFAVSEFGQYTEAK